MPALRIQLFGKLSVMSDGRELEKLDASKAQELLCYLLVHRARPHPRESLAALLWGDASTEKSKKYLRQALWHLQGVLEPQACDAATAAAPDVLRAEHDWVQLNAGCDVWLDVEAFERAFASSQGRHGAQLCAESNEALRAAVALYRGDLLEGWYQDWCLFERERLQNMYLLMLDKLMGYCDAHADYEAGQLYGALILRQDRAHERTHRQLMTMHYRAGDRTAAIRQYQRCVAALREELDVEPDAHTAKLYQQIRADKLDAPAPASTHEHDSAHERVSARQPNPAHENASAQELIMAGGSISSSVVSISSPAGEAERDGGSLSMPEVLGRLRQLQQVVADVQQRIQHDIHAIEAALKQKASRVLNRQS
jgi:DNA-binding SARP family transcriptional activator